MSSDPMIVELTIDRLSKTGEGVAHHDGRGVFVAGALPGERVKVALEPEGKVLRAELLEVIAASPSRQVPECAHASSCGGCDWLHLQREGQRAAKLEIVLGTLRHLGALEPAELEVLPTARCGFSEGFRRRAVLHTAKGRLGFYGRRSHQLVPVEHCRALKDPLQQAPGKLEQLLQPILPQVEEVHLLSVLAKAAMAVKLKGPIKPRMRQTVEAAVKTLEWEGAVVLAFGKPPELIGNPVLRGHAPLRPEIPLFYRPDAFSQAQEETNEALVAAAVDALGPEESSRVLELYCGNGNFTFATAQLAASVVAVETAGISLELARRSSAQGRVQNVRFIQGDALKVAAGLASEGATFDQLLADPPRGGAPGLGALAARLGVRRVAYVACDPASLARDAQALVAAGFSPVSLQLVEMFPQTHHTEAVMAFTRKAA